MSKHSDAVIRNQKASPEKHKARYILYRALKSGTIRRPKNCDSCGVLHPRLHGHHDNYSKALDVLWLCPPCHALKHKGRKYRRYPIKPPNKKERARLRRLNIEFRDALIDKINSEKDRRLLTTSELARKAGVSAQLAHLTLIKKSRGKKTIRAMLSALDIKGPISGL